MFPIKASLSGISLLMVLAVAIALPVTGCGSGTVQHDEATSYTPESLAQELSYRVQSLRDTAKARTRAPETKSEVALEDRIRGAADDSTKKAPEALTLDDLVADTLAKARTIRSQAISETSQAIISAIRQDDRLTADEKDEIAGKIEARASGS